jgi:FlaA1/EpsC-like NDP-sugar epimerase
LIDDDTAKRGTYVHGLRVLGGRELIPQAVHTLGIEEVIIAIPSALPSAIREFVKYSRGAGVKRIKVLPGIDELLTTRVAHQAIRDVKMEDLLGRDLVRLESDRMRRFLTGKTVLVTGAGGSIGSELARQLADMEAVQLILLDCHESAIFELQGELSRNAHPSAIQYMIADIRDGDKIRRIFGQCRPNVVYHAAAYKHVPLMEVHADEAVRTNVFGTLTVAEAALEYGCQAFVLISTDKAVSPASVMGSTKRVAEMVTRALNDRGRTRFMAVRFGNVIGSRGSVIPVMQEQIRLGGPVTVTHPDMTRYLMSTREAVALVLQASATDQSHEVLVLDMGEPVRIFELAQELIRLSGFEPDRDIPIVFTGIRPGEKLHEVLETSDEPLERTGVPKVLAVASNGSLDEVTLRLALQELDRLSRATDMTGIRSILRRLTTEPEKIPLWNLGS